MSLLDVLRSRRSVRAFREEPPSRNAIEALLEAAITAPSASNAQPWRFLVVSRRALIDDMARAVREAVDLVARHVDPAWEESFRSYGDYFTRFEKAPVVIAALHRPLTILSNMVDDALPAEVRDRIAAMERDSGLIGVSLSIQNLLLMAHELRLGASGMTGPLLASDRLRVLLSVPPSWTIAALVPVGYPAEVPPPTSRKPLGRVVQWIA